MNLNVFLFLILVMLISSIIDNNNNNNNNNNAIYAFSLSRSRLSRLWLNYHYHSDKNIVKKIDELSKGRRSLYSQSNNRLLYNKCRFFSRIFNNNNNNNDDNNMDHDGGGSREADQENLLMLRFENLARPEAINLIQLWGHNKIKVAPDDDDDDDDEGYGKGIPDTYLPNVVKSTPWGISVTFEGLRGGSDALLIEASDGDEKQTVLEIMKTKYSSHSHSKQVSKLLESSEMLIVNKFCDDIKDMRISDSEGDVQDVQIHRLGGNIILNNSFRNSVVENKHVYNNKDNNKKNANRNGNGNDDDVDNADNFLNNNNNNNRNNNEEKMKPLRNKEDFLKFEEKVSKSPGTKEEVLQMFDRARQEATQGLESKKVVEVLLKERQVEEEKLDDKEIKAIFKKAVRASNEKDSIAEMMSDLADTSKIPYKLARKMGEKQISREFLKKEIPNFNETEYDRVNVELGVILREALSTRDNHHLSMILESNTDTLLSMYFIPLMTERMRSADAQENGNMKSVLKKIVDKAIELIKDLHETFQFEEKMQLDKIKAICKVAIEDETQLPEFVKNNRFEYDSKFISYLDYAIQKEIHSILSGGLDPMKHPSSWLQSLKIIKKGVYSELFIDKKDDVEMIEIILRFDDPKDRRGILKVFVNELPPLSLRGFKQVTENIVDSITNKPLDQIPGGKVFLNKIKQLGKDVEKLLPESKLQKINKELFQQIGEQDTVSTVPPPEWGINNQHINNNNNNNYEEPKIEDEAVIMEQLKKYTTELGEDGESLSVVKGDVLRDTKWSNNGISNLDDSKDVPLSYFQYDVDDKKKENRK